ncbi:MAG TPA: alpha/beta fold hydrolase [Stackebrandtia sp.]|jgi:alpha-beta hydrolase superfamily lysophospholipase|uniref:alpha/beta hydrolase n=1 Tax=Stackebrandtia sp. TaxID=2023065 RepID=UPI002D727D01|nr:alpha/beta fold hydrolase [Stackebrandtia sp.]HZE42063.1 alpha/beta fold hydrolase [Stackebrandtia sp.]
MNRRRLAVAVITVLAAGLLALPIRVGPVTADKVHFGRATPLSGDRQGLTQRWLSADRLRDGEPGRVRVIERTPRHAVGDVIFVHGHADRADNHAALFAAWAKAGLHVIAPDLPSHGETTTRGIDTWTQSDLAALVAVLDHGLANPSRPLIVAGWSFGGLVVTRLLQDHDQLAALDRRPSAAVLLTPAIAPRLATGGDGIVRHQTLTHDKRPPTGGPPDPVTPLLNPVFVARLLAEAWAARSDPLPSGIPVQVIAADPSQDKYVADDDLVAWASRQPTVTSLVTCAGSRHGVDLEVWPQGPAAIAATTDFLSRRVPKVREVKTSGLDAVSDEENPCRTR